MNKNLILFTYNILYKQAHKNIYLLINKLDDRNILNVSNKKCKINYRVYVLYLHAGRSLC